MTPAAQEQEMKVMKSRIMELNSALFFTESISIIKLPTHMISDVEVDAEGDVWFAIPKPGKHIDAYDKEMPAKLDFFKKGMDFFVKIRGIATLQTDVEAIMNNENISVEMRERMTAKNMIGVSVKRVESEIVDNTPKPAQRWFQASRSQLSSWFF